MKKVERIFRNEPSPHYEDWIILEENDEPTLEDINNFKEEKK